MTAWDIDLFVASTYGPDTLPALRKQGREGWEPVGLIREGNGLIVLFKRPIQERVLENRMVAQQRIETDGTVTDLAPIVLPPPKEAARHAGQRGKTHG